MSKATAQMYGTKIEIVLPKAEPGHWNTLEVSKPVAAKVASNDEAKEKFEAPAVETVPPSVTSGNDSDVDLEEIEPLRAVRITEA